ncbi:porin [Vibrio sp. UCD-FRSSP16_10]|uniref:porin n=1 Tax=unclassified Vibrio TaxID=2614977 RepID=UPI0007FE5283|nr:MULTISPECIES: porin [unclassified Vibrio]OBT16017.1 porin [Vibrio sp. UCD-FRSSP16_30]OBT21099.1 porin [Vibrio sp. UCD-FRSSP16_10]
MKKVCNKTAIAIALTSVLATASVAAAETGQVGVISDFNVDVYGVAAISVVNYNVSDNRDASSGFAVENESRIGFRASKEMVDNFLITMQIESGYVDNTDWGHGGVSGGVLGFRDTFLGASGDWGNLRVGRVLTPLYEIVDWPFSNPGLGATFDWGGISGHYDRQSNQVRFDSANYGGFTFAASVGRDDNDNGGGSATRDAYFYSGNAKYSFSTVTLMGAAEAATRANLDETSAYIVGFEAGLPAGFGIAAAFKHEEVDNKADVSKGKQTQDSISVIGQWWNGPLGIKAGYAANFDSETNGTSQDDANSIASVQVMGVINGFVPYVRVAARSDFTAEKDTDIVTRFGLEYGF